MTLRIFAMSDDDGTVWELGHIETGYPETEFEEFEAQLVQGLRGLADTIENPPEPVSQLFLPWDPEVIEEILAKASPELARMLRGVIRIHPQPVGPEDDLEEPSEDVDRAVTRMRAETDQTLASSGYQITGVNDPLCPWAYTIGLNLKGRPEIAISGLHHSTSSAWLRDLVEATGALRDGEHKSLEEALTELVPTWMRSGRAEIRQVHRSWLEGHTFNYSRAYFNSLTAPPTVQIVWSDAEGRMPDEPGSQAGMQAAWWAERTTELVFGDNEVDLSNLSNSTQIRVLMKTLQEHAVTGGCGRAISMHLKPYPENEQVANLGMDVGVLDGSGWLTIGNRPRDPDRSAQEAGTFPGEYFRTVNPELSAADQESGRRVLIEYAWDSQQSHEVPICANVPFAKIIDAVVEFFETSQRPTVVEWEPHR